VTVLLVGEGFHWFYIHWQC